MKAHFYPTVLLTFDDEETARKFIDESNITKEIVNGEEVVTYLRHFGQDRNTVLLTFDDEETARKFIEAWNEVHK